MQNLLTMKAYEMFIFSFERSRRHHRSTLVFPVFFLHPYTRTPIQTAFDSLVHVIGEAEWLQTRIIY